MCLILSALKGCVAGVVFLAAATIDEHSLVPIGAAIGVGLFVGIGLWKAGRISQRFEATVCKNSADIEALKDTVHKLESAFDRFSHGRNFESDLREAPLVPVAMGTLMTVLIVDDNETDRFIVRHKIAQHFHVVEANSLREANEAMKQQDIACVLLDLDLTDSLPSETVATFLGLHPTAVCVAISGNDDPQAEAKAIAAGADSYVVKSSRADPEYLARQIRTAVRRRKTKGLM